MRPVAAPALLRALRLLLPLAACAWGPAALASPFWSSPDDLVHLYTSSPRKSFHLQIHADGRVDGSPEQTVDSTLVIRTVRPGHVMIAGAKSGLLLCMDTNGNLFGLRSFGNEDCVFKHTMLENGYDAYNSPRHNFLVSLGRVKEALVPRRKLPPFSEFLTRRNEIPLAQFSQPRPQQAEPRDEEARNEEVKLCGGILTGKIPEAIPEGELHPCLTSSRFADQDPNGVTLSQKFPSPSWSS